MFRDTGLVQKERLPPSFPLALRKGAGQKWLGTRGRIQAPHRPPLALWEQTGSLLDREGKLLASTLVSLTPLPQDGL